MSMISDTVEGARGRGNRGAVPRSSTLAVLVLALLPFLAVRQFPHVHDDHLLRGVGSLAADPRADLGTLWSADFFGTVEQPRGQTGFWRPLVLLSFHAEALLTGRREVPLAWLGHVVTLLCHAAACVALLQLAHALGLSRGGALLCAGLFAVHPVHVETVAWASGRTDSLPVALAFGSTAWWISQPNRRAGPWVAVAGLTAALLCKETAVLLVGVAALAAWLTGRPWRSAWGPPGLALALALGLRVASFGLLPAADPAAYSGPSSEVVRWFTWASILPDLLGLSLWPVVTSPVRPVAEASSLTAPGVIPGLACLALAVIAWAASLVHRRAAPAVALALIVGTLLMLAPWTRVPTGFAEVAGPLYERYVYAASAGVALLLGWICSRWLAQHPWWSWAGLALLALGVAPVTAARTAAWDGDAAFARAGLALAPESADLWQHLGAAHLERLRASGDPRAGLEAQGAFDRALELDPGHRFARLNRFIARALVDDPAAADDALELLERFGDDPGVLHNVAAWRARRGDAAGARALYQRELATGAALPGAREALTALEAALEAETGDR